MNEVSLRATARVKLIKKDENDNIVEVIEKTVELSDEEANALWLSQQQDCNS